MDGSARVTEDLRADPRAANGRKSKATRFETRKEWCTRLDAEASAELHACEKAHRFHPHRLRHSAATLSDYVIGSFNTCRLDMPNTATVQADGLTPLTSNKVMLTILDGDEAIV